MSFRLPASSASSDAAAERSHAVGEQGIGGLVLIVLGSVAVMTFV